jgi:hypothetical protein
MSYRTHKLLFRQASCGPYKDSAFVQLYKKNEVIKEAKADGRLVESLMKADVGPPASSTSSSSSSTDIADDGSPPDSPGEAALSKNSKKCKYINGKGKEIEMPKVKKPTPNSLPVFISQKSNFNSFFFFFFFFF